MFFTHKNAKVDDIPRKEEICSLYVGYLKKCLVVDLPVGAPKQAPHDFAYISKSALELCSFKGNCTRNQNS